MGTLSNIVYLHWHEGTLKNYIFRSIMYIYKVQPIETTTTNLRYTNARDHHMSTCV